MQLKQYIKTRWFIQCQGTVVLYENMALSSNLLGLAYRVEPQI